MKAVNFVGSDITLGQPEGWDSAKQGVHVDAIRAKRMMIGNTPAIMTLWQPETQEERDMVANGHPIVLVVLGTAFPPVSVSVSPDVLVPVTEAADDHEAIQ